MRRVIDFWLRRGLILQLQEVADPLEGAVIYNFTGVSEKSV